MKARRQSDGVLRRTRQIIRPAAHRRCSRYPGATPINAESNTPHEGPHRTASWLARHSRRSAYSDTAQAMTAWAYSRLLPGSMLAMVTCQEEAGARATLWEAQACWQGQCGRRATLATSTMPFRI